MSERPTLVIGDVHGHLDRLTALLEQEAEKHDGNFEVIQLGDLGHFGGSAGSPTRDKMVWESARDGMVDLVLWGNHDRAVVDPTHIFGGYARPTAEVTHIMALMMNEGRLRMAAARHGHLLTHAGLHAQWENQPDVPCDKDDPYEVADYLNSLVDQDPGRRMDGSITNKNRAVLDAIGQKRGGWSPYGGILWRDFDEDLYAGFPQIFGHSASKFHLVRQPEGTDSWCIDIGGKGGLNDPEANCLAGLWLPEKKVVRVDL